MDIDHSSDPACAEATPMFETAFRELILSAFGHGTTVEDIWEIESAVTDAPNWRVTIAKIPAQERRFDPTLLEE